MIYIPFPNDQIASPVEEGLYVLSGEDVYVLSEDVVADPDIEYFIAYDDTVEDYVLYDIADMEGVENPSAELLYEYDDEEDVYFVTLDTEVDPEKEYYTFLGDTTDYESYDDDDLYYPLIPGDDEYESITNPAEEGLYVQDEYGNYVLTGDVIVDDEVQYYRKYEEFGYEVTDEEDDLDDSFISLSPTSYENGLVNYGIYESEPPENVAEDDVYYPFSTTFVEHPIDFELYEIVNGEYTLTNDETVDIFKTYYKKTSVSDYRPVEVPENENPNWLYLYELIDDDYIRTPDNEVDPEKTYYIYDPVDPVFDEYDDPNIQEYAIGELEGQSYVDPSLEPIT